MKSIITPITTTVLINGTGSIKRIVELMGHSRHDRVLRAIRKIGAKTRWKIEEVFRILKRVFSLDKFFVRTAESMLGFFAVAFVGFMLGEELRILKGITHYQLQHRLRSLGKRALYHDPLFAL